MNQLDALRQISNTLLYEGCMLYPYRASALKNQRPGWTFGALLPPGYVAANPGESDFMRSQVLAVAPEDAEFVAEIRFLQLHEAQQGEESALSERCVALSTRWSDLLLCSPISTFAFPMTGAPGAQTIAGIAELGAEPIGDRTFRVTLRVRNTSSLPAERPGRPNSRDLALNYSLLSANALLSLGSGEFISLLEPPESLREAADGCRQTGVFPVLAGDAQTRSAMLVSPIILYDFPQVAPESRGDFFDGSEIDEMLALRVLTLSEAERTEIQRAGRAGQEILARTEALSGKEMQRMHGALRPGANGERQE